jgi:hypothetical protein
VVGRRWPRVDSRNCSICIRPTSKSRRLVARFGVARKYGRSIRPGWMPFRTCAWSFLDIVEGQDALAGEIRVAMTHTASLLTPNGPVPATGRTVVLESCDVARFRDGLVVSFHSYFDQLAIMAQLGLLPGLEPEPVAR